jgi:hypothetical protein
VNKLVSLLLFCWLCQMVSAEEHENKAKGFAVTPAEGWTVKADPEAFGLNLVVRAPGEDPYSPSFQVMVWPGESTISDYFKQQVVQLEGTADAEPEFEQAQLGGRKAGAFTYTVNKALKTKSVYTSFDGSTFVVSKTGRIKNFEDQNEAFDKMFDSFRFVEK